MSDDSDSGPNSRRGMSLPGQPTEEAIAEVGSDAGKSVVRGFANLFDAQFGEYVTKRRAKADAAHLAIETESQIARDNALVEARRKLELTEIEHQDLVRRRLDRMYNELGREQHNLESIERKAIEFAEKDLDRDKAREIDQDWLFRAADLAQKISDKEVQDLWARAVSSAAIETTTPLSAAALQTLGLLDSRTARDFRKFVMIAARLGFFAAIDQGAPLNQIEPQNIEIVGLVDLGLIQHQASPTPFRLRDDFTIMAGTTSNVGLSLFHDRYILTKRGMDIANAVFRGQKIEIDEGTEHEYLKNLLQRELHHNASVTIIIPAPIKGEQGTRIVLRANKPPGGEGVAVPAITRLSARLQRLLDWANDFCTIEVHLGYDFD
jgi:hypothetical protein